YSVKELNLSAFNHCSNQLCVYINNDIPPIVSTESPIIQKKLDCKFYVPIGSVEVYKNADGWKEYADQIFGFSF
ncbi:MAG: hypothetical protein IJ976_04120, partial [Alistipes sp.]|nr:hypothetical protein [Alistipes sp.]